VHALAGDLHRAPHVAFSHSAAPKAARFASHRENVLLKFPLFSGSKTHSPEAILRAKVEREHGPFAPIHLEALAAVPREHFVREVDRAACHEDTPLPLDDSGLSTISAPHAYLLSFRLTDLGPGDRLVELGAGTGYGAALASFIVGPEGHVTSFEIDASLADRARLLLADRSNVEIVHADAISSATRWNDANKIILTFAIQSLPDAWLDQIPEGGILVAPLGLPAVNQRLVRVERKCGLLRTSDHGAVRYVFNRSSARA
jgi:protein-L-isoaspartate(D-aspartate) O-methyltransferase